MDKIKSKSVKRSMALLILMAMLLTQFFGMGSLQSRAYAVDSDILMQDSQIGLSAEDTVIEEEPDAAAIGQKESDAAVVAEQEPNSANEDYQKNLTVFAAPSGDNVDFMEDSLKNSLRAYLSFNGSTANDITGKITTTTTGAIQYTDGKKGKALSLDGNSYVSLDNLTYGQDSFTFAFWERTAPLTVDGDIALISNKDWTGSGSAAGYAFVIDDKYDGNSKRSAMWFNIAPSRVDVRDATDSNLKIADNTWHYIVGALDRTAGKVSIYIDGKPVKSSSISGTIGNSIDTAYATVLGGSDGGKALIKADFDEVALFNRALTADEAAKLYGYYTGGAVITDKAQLKSVITEAQKLYDNSTGAAIELKENLKAAIDGSNAVNNNDKADQVQVDNAVKALYAAIRTFKGVKMSFQVLSDLHISTSSDNTANSRFINALKDIQMVDGTSQAIVIAGDITDGGKDAEYDALNTILAQIAHPEMNYAVGNHDIRWMDEKTAYDRFLNKTKMPGIYYDKTIGGYQFLFLGSEQNLKDAAYISDQQFTWLEGKLKNADPNKPVFLFLHQPIYGLLPGTARWEKTDWIIQQDRLKRLLGQYPQTLFFTGHTHYTLQTSFKYDEKYCTMFNTGGTYYLENAITYRSESGSQGLYVEVYDGKVVVRGREFSNNSWIETAEHTVNFPVTHIPPVDLESPKWSQDSKNSVLETGEKSITISWSEASDNVKVDKYRIYSDDTLIDTVAGNVNEYKLTALKAGKEYTLKIAALDEEENQSDFITVKVTTKESSTMYDVDIQSEFKVSYVSNEGVAEEAVSAISECAGKYVNAYVNITCNELTAKNIVVVAVSYDRNGAMLASSSNYSMVNPSEKVTFEAGILASEDVAKIKLFILDANDYKGIYTDMNYTPISESIVLN